jgi:rhamnose transport system ATP-binding protein
VTTTAHTTTDAPPLVSAEGLWKNFGGADVLKNAGIELRGGEIHAIVGENGAGKSTLAKILGGAHTPTRGVIRVGGQITTIPNPRSAIAQGIALIHQEPLTFPDLSVAENIFVGRQPRRFGTLDWSAMRRESSELLGRLGARIDPRVKIRGLSVADQQMVEMAAALSQHARVFLLDETTASLTPHEVADLFRVMRQLQADGAALAFIGHRMEEIFEICDRITVMRDGEVVARLRTSETSIQSLAPDGRPADRGDVSPRPWRTKSVHRCWRCAACHGAASSTMSASTSAPVKSSDCGIGRGGAHGSRAGDLRRRQPDAARCA